MAILADSTARVSYAPTPHVLRSYCNSNLPWWKALAELIDNSFDHGATRIVISAAKGIVEVQDDGCGMKSIVSALTLGDHAPSATTKLGMYGVGLKDAWLSVGDKIEVTTVRGGVESWLMLDMNELDRNFLGPVPTSKESVAASGTTIRLYLRKRRNLPGNDVWSSLAWAFTPALEAGRQIVRRDGSMKKRPLAPVKLPPLTDRVTEQFDVDGKPVSIDIGIMADGQKLERGPFWIQYGHRIIRDASIGAKAYSTLRVAGMIVLGKGWSLSKNKDDLADYSEELGDAIHQRIKSLLERAEKLTQDIESEALKSELESMINSAIGEARKESRQSPKESTGPILPGDTGRKRKRAAKIHLDQPDSVNASDGSKSKKRRGISVGWCYLADDAMGRYDGLSNRVDLNLEHPYVKAVKQTSNTPALYAIALALVAEYACNHRDRNLTAFAIHDFGRCFGGLMKQVRVDHGDRK